MKKTSRRSKDGVVPICLVLGATLFVLGCPGFGSQQEAPIDLAGEPCEVVQRIVDQRCVRCHGAIAREGAPHGVRFDILDDTAIDIGLITMSHRVLARAGDGSMPPLTAPERPVTADELAVIQEWVASGSDSTACGAGGTDDADVGTADAPDGRGDATDAADADADVDAEVEVPDIPVRVPTLPEVHAAVFQPTCGAHHNGGSQLPFLGLDDELLERLQGFGFQNRAMPWVTPGDSSESYLFHKISGTQRDVRGSGTRMPVGPRLTEEQIELVRAWIDGGAPVE